MGRRPGKYVECTGTGWRYDGEWTQIGGMKWVVNLEGLGFRLVPDWDEFERRRRETLDPEVREGEVAVREGGRVLGTWTVGTKERRVWKRECP